MFLERNVTFFSLLLLKCKIVLFTNNYELYMYGELSVLGTPVPNVAVEVKGRLSLCEFY